jgi:Rrf2 family protein
MVSQTTEYALRAVIGMAEVSPSQPILGRDLAKHTQIPPKYLAKVLVTLRNGGLLEAMRGINGGYRLLRKAEEIRLLEVVELFEGLRAKPNCLLRATRDCSDEGACSAHGSWKTVRETYIHFLENTTIAELMNRGGAPAHLAELSS